MAGEAREWAEGQQPGWEKSGGPNWGPLKGGPSQICLLDGSGNGIRDGVGGGR